MPATATRAVPAGHVEQVPLPPPVRARSALARIDYADAFRLPTPRQSDRTAPGWARAMLEEAPAGTRTALRRGWCALGLRHGSTADPERVLGWRVLAGTPDHAVLGGDSLFGMRAELHFVREPGALLFATVVTLRNPLARAAWAAVAPRHRRVVRHLLAETGRRAAAGV